MWGTSKSEKPEVDWPKVQQELEERVGAISFGGEVGRRGVRY